jgi:hypothetical protein
MMGVGNVIATISYTTVPVITTDVVYNWPNCSSSGQYQYVAVYGKYSSTVLDLKYSSNYGVTFSYVSTASTNRNSSYLFGAGTTNDSGTKVVLMAGNSTFYYSTNSGSTWSTVTISTTSDYYGYFLYSKSADMFICFAGKGLYSSGVSTWSTISATYYPGVANTFYLTPNSTGTTAYMIASGGFNAIGTYTYKSYWSGLAWSHTSLGTSNGLPSAFQWNAVSCDNTGNYILLIGRTSASGGSSLVYLSTNGGTNFSSISQFTGLTSNSALIFGSAVKVSSNVSPTGQWMIIPNSIDGYIYYSSNYGSTWATFSSPINKLYSTCAFLNDGTTFLVNTTSDVVYKFTGFT